MMYFHLLIRREACGQNDYTLEGKGCFPLCKEFPKHATLPLLQYGCIDSKLCSSLAPKDNNEKEIKAKDVI
jgi:hypothetical protein